MKEIQKTFFALGTANSIFVSYNELAELEIMDTLEQIKLKILKLDDLLSVFKNESEISQINLAAGKKLVAVSEDTYYIVLKAIEYSKLSNGAFDITTYPLSKLWSIGKKGDFVPTINEINNAKELVNYQDIIIKESPNRIGLKKVGQAIDLGGIAKGYAADLTKKLLIQHNVFNAIINFGGTVTIIGEKKVGIQNPDSKTGIPFGMLQINNQAVITSGSYERYFIKDLKKYHHLIDPFTGYPSDNELLSITVLGDKAIKMDAMATAVFILGLEKGLKLLKQENIEAIFILNNYKVYTTNGLKNKFKLIKTQKEKENE